MDAYQLERHEVRVLGALAEKQALTPDTYPMTVNALISACNQLTSRDPVMRMSEGDILTALDGLMAKKLVTTRTPAGSRVAKYEHRLPYEWNLEGARHAVLTLLMLRGAQTAAEIRARSGRIYSFSDVDEVESALVALQDKYPPMAQKLARQPGAREVRWTHLLCGEVVETSPEAESIDLGLIGRVAALEAQLDALETRLAEIESRLDD